MQKAQECCPHTFNKKLKSGLNSNAHLSSQFSSTCGRKMIAKIGPRGDPIIISSTWIKILLKSFQTLSESWNFSWWNIQRLFNDLNLATKEPFFTFNNKLYQVDGVVVRSTLPQNQILANIFLSHHKGKLTQWMYLGMWMIFLHFLHDLILPTHFQDVF